jgi:hypothetical protein
MKIQHHFLLMLPLFFAGRLSGTEENSGNLHYRHPIVRSGLKVYMLDKEVGLAFQVGFDRAIELINDKSRGSELRFRAELLKQQIAEMTKLRAKLVEKSSKVFVYEVSLDKIGVGPENQVLRLKGDRKKGS